MPIKLTKQEFIDRANSIHSNKYDYNEIDYINNYTDIIINCPTHGKFKQRPGHHLSGIGCPACSNKHRPNTEQFIKKANQVHEGKYNYSKVNYINAYTKVCIICSVHGEFWQTPSNHLNGQGCVRCFRDSDKFTTKDFIQKAIEVHNNFYNYDKVKYTNSQYKIIITCPVHGDFEQEANSHLNGRGCPNCKASTGEIAIKAILDKHNIIYKSQYNLPEIVANYKIDFYLPEYRLLIEFHGKQHYEYISFFHDGDYTFEDQKRRDNLVRDAAIRFKYHYLEFNYKQLKQLSREQFEQLVISSVKNRA